MPTYPYTCDTCHKEQDIFHKITDTPKKTCPHCGQNTLRRLPGGGAGLSFQGSGFYITDYKDPPAKTNTTP